MAKKGSRFRHAAAMAQELAVSARKRKDTVAERQATVISGIATTLANAERSFDSQANELISALSRLGKSIKQQGAPAGFSADSESDYFVGITPAKSAFGDARYTGLVGKRVGRGPVNVSPGRSTRAMTAAFAKILSAQAQLSQLQSEVERLKHRK